MKHTFLLDENILHFAVKGVDRRDDFNLDAVELLRLIARNCHTIVADSVLLGRYYSHLANLMKQPSPALQPTSFLNNFVHNSLKFRFEYADPPDLPDDSDIPPKDTHIVRAALISNTLIVTGDEELQATVNSSKMGLRALSPKEAIELAREE